MPVPGNLVPLSLRSVYSHWTHFEFLLGLPGTHIVPQSTDALIKLKKLITSDRNQPKRWKNKFKKNLDRFMEEGKS